MNCNTSLSLNLIFILLLPALLFLSKLCQFLLLSFFLVAKKTLKENDDERIENVSYILLS
jgi:hypothetical protein